MLGKDTDATTLIPMMATANYRGEIAIHDIC